MASTHWVFLRGLIRQHRHWEDFPQRFQAAFPDARIVLLDLPGNGDLYREDSCSSMAEMVESAREQLQAHVNHEPVNLLALSLGAMIGIEWMERYPEEIRRAVLMNTSLRGMSRFRERLRPATYGAFLRGLLFASPLEREQLVLELSVNLYPHKQALAEKWAAYARAQPTGFMNALRQLFAAATYTAPPARPHEHVLLLQSLGDHLVDPVCTTRLAECWRWPLVSHPTAGHDLTLDDGDWVIAQIRHWLAEEASADATGLSSSAD